MDAAAQTSGRYQSWRPWIDGERESFFAAIARHRRAAWRVTLTSSGANLVVAIIVALLMAPLFYAAIALGCDLANLIVPVPNLVDVLGRWFGPVVDAPESIPFSRWIFLGAVAALPGLLWTTGVLFVLARSLRLSGTFAREELAGDAPDTSILAEQRFANVVAEMATAAGMPEPRVLISGAPVVNAAVFGRDERHATIVVSRALLAQLNREQMQGIAAHLVGSIANGDMTIGLRVATTMAFFGVITRFAGAFGEAGELGAFLARLSLAVFRPTAASSRRLVAEISDPLTPADSKAARDQSQEAKEKDDRRKLLWMPLMGPLFISGIFCGLIGLFLLQPLVALAWRQRKYMADATAVRLTRDPDTLAGALAAMSGAGAAFQPWTAHLSVVQPANRSAGLLQSPVVPAFPSIARRMRALNKMGAHAVPVESRFPRQVLVLIAPLAALAAVLAGFALFLLVFLSIALSMLFLGLPFGIMHALLRLIGH
jgi:Zn-dependent protease with chaperone function